MSSKLPLLFACSGCSHAGRLAYDLAQELDRRGIAGMSCLAGVGARKSHFLRQLRNRNTWVIDGCPIQCARGVFDETQQHLDAHTAARDRRAQTFVIIQFHNRALDPRHVKASRRSKTTKPKQSIR